MTLFPCRCQCCSKLEKDSFDIGSLKARFLETPPKSPQSPEQGEVERLRAAVNEALYELTRIHERDWDEFQMRSAAAAGKFRVMRLLAETPPQASAQKVEPRNDVFVYGTDACKNCDTGRITLYARSCHCIGCQNSLKSPNQLRDEEGGT